MGKTKKTKEHRAEPCRPIPIRASVQDLIDHEWLQWASSQWKTKLDYVSDVIRIGLNAAKNKGGH